MLINVKMFTEEAYKTLQKNYKEVYKMINDHPSDCTWLNDYLGYDPFEEKKYVIEDFNLEYSDDYDKVALNNAIVMYEKLKDLPRYILCDNRFWGWVLFSKFYKQAQKAIDFTESIILSRWLIGNSRRSLMLGVASRQFFKVELSVQDNENKYDLTEFIIKNHNPYKNITMRNIGMLNNVVVPYLMICKEMQSKFKVTLNDEFCSTLMKYASQIGSVMLIDIMSVDEIYSILYDKILFYISSKMI